MHLQWTDIYSRGRFSILLVLVMGLQVGQPMLLGLGFATRWYDWLVSRLVLGESSLSAISRGNVCC